MPVSYTALCHVKAKNNKVAIGRCTRIGAWATALTVLGLYLAFLAVPNIFLDDAADSHSELVWNDTNSTLITVEALL